MDVLVNVSGPEVVSAELTPHLMGGQHATIWFANGYGVSVINSPAFSHGVELAVLHKYYDPTPNMIATGRDSTLCYATPITHDVLGWLTPEKLAAAVAAVGSLVPNPLCSHESPDSWDDED